jgi:hypothetical protein
VVSSPAWHREFYGKALRYALEGARSRPHVVISGTADFSMLEQVVNVARSVSSDAPSVDITVVDRCETPLAACEWYAAEEKIEIKVRRTDILEAHRFVESCTLIVTDAFLTRFDREQCAAVINAWHALLDIGGSVVTTVRLHDRGETLRDPTADQADFVVRVEKLVGEQQSVIFSDPARIADAARIYAARMHSSDLGDEVEIVKLFESNGFEVVWQERAQVAGELHPVDYLRIVAKKL